MAAGSEQLVEQKTAEGRLHVWTPHTSLQELRSGRPWCSPWHVLDFGEEGAMPVNISLLLRSAVRYAHSPRIANRKRKWRQHVDLGRSFARGLPEHGLAGPPVQKQERPTQSTTDSVSITMCVIWSQGKEHMWPAACLNNSGTCQMERTSHAKASLRRLLGEVFCACIAILLPSAVVEHR